MAETNLGRISVQRPFIDGYVSDLPAEALGPQMAAKLENMIFPRGVAEHRRGWVYADGGSAIGSGVHGGVFSAAFKRAAVTRRACILHPSSGNATLYMSSGTSIASTSTLGSGTLLIPRAVYRDEMIFCGQDGITPLIRYGGSPGFARYWMSAATVTSGERRITGMTPSLPAGFDLGSFVSVPGGFTTTAKGPNYTFRVNGGVAAGNQVSIERLVFAVSNSSWASYFAVSPFGTAWPGVPVYEAGTFTAPASAGGPVTATGQGTDWSKTENISTFGNNADMSDGLLLFDAAGASAMNSIESIVSATSITILSKGWATPSQYKVMRRMPFTDVAVFRSCLFGAGVKQQASRLYYNPPGHDIGLSPKLSAGRSGTFTGALYESPDAVKEFETEWVDVPSSFDADPIVALLPAEAMLLVVKRGSVYRVTGDYPYFRVDKSGDACGCLDIRSAITDDTGVYWAGDTGIWTLRGGVPYNLAGGPDRPGILAEWRNLMAEGITGPTYASTSWIVCGVAEGHLIVSVKTQAGTSRCYVMDLRAQRWCGVFTNVLPNAAWSSRVPGETDRLYVMQDTPTRRIIDAAPMFNSNGLGLGAPADGNGTANYAKAWTGSSFFFPGTLEREHRLVDVDVALRHTSIGTPTGVATVSVAYGDAVDVGADNTVTAGTVTSNIAGAVRRSEFRPGTRGRRHQLRVEQTTVDSDESAFEIHEAGGFVRPLGPRR